MPRPPRQTGPRHHAVNIPNALVVFIGGCLGTGCRYLLTGLPGVNDSPILGTGTFVANMLASCCYAAITAYLSQAAWMPSRRRELTGRGCGMGICGGLSTSSTLCVEVVVAMREGLIVTGLLYLLLTFALGLAVALVGARLGAALARRHGTGPTIGDHGDAGGMQPDEMQSGTSS